MAKVIIQIEDVGDELVFQAAIDPPLTEDKAIFSTAELVGLYLREHMSAVLEAAVVWAKTPDTVQEAQIKAPDVIKSRGLILPPDMLGGPL